MTKVKSALSEVNDVDKPIPQKTAPRFVFSFCLQSMTNKQTKSKVRKSLQTIQESTNEQNDTGKKMVYAEEKNLQTNVKKSKAVERIITAEKENAPVVRRSKRKTAITETDTYTESPEEPTASKSTVKNAKSKAKKPTSKSKKSRSTAKTVAEQIQTKLNFSPVPVLPKTIEVPENVCETVEPEKDMLATSFSSVTEDSGYCPSAGTSQECISHSIAVFNSPDIRNYQVAPINSESSILTIESPPISYWKDIAEQRRICLDKVLHENELLHDQLAVLEAENSQLKELVKEAEELAQIVKGIIQ